MRALGGSFEIETAPNRGTTATLTLPLSASSTTEAEPMLVEASQEGFGKESHNSLPPGEKQGPSVCYWWMIMPWFAKG